MKKLIVLLLLLLTVLFVGCETSPTDVNVNTEVTTGEAISVEWVAYSGSNDSKLFYEGEEEDIPDRFNYLSQYFTKGKNITITFYENDTKIMYESVEYPGEYITYYTTNNKIEYKVD